MILFTFLVINLLEVNGGLCSTFYVANSPHNESCFSGNHKFSPCMTLQRLSSYLLTQQNLTCLSIYFIDQNYFISETVQFVFPNLTQFKLLPLSNGTTVNITCVSDLSFSYAGVQILVVEGIRFYKCGKIKPIFSLEGDTFISEFATFTNVAFHKSRQISVKISRAISQVEILNCSFIEGLEDYGFYLNSPTATTLFSQIMFMNNIAPSVQIMRGVLATFSDCTFFNNSDSSINVNTVNTIIEGSLFSYNTQTPIIVEYDPRTGRGTSCCNFTIFRSIFHSNTAVSGGVMRVNCPCKMEVLHSIFRGNHASDSGGVALLYATSASFFNCSFLNNSASKGTGGGIFYQFTARSIIMFFKVINCTFEGNQATIGGALCIYRNMNTTIHQCRFIRNTANSFGGALVVAISGNFDGNSLSITSCEFESNSASYNSGALYTKDTETVKIQNCTFSHNWANSHAGAAYVGMSNLGLNSRMLLSNITFVSNHADEGGAVKFEKRLIGKFSNCKFINNTARFGGALQAISPYYYVGNYIVVTLSITESYFEFNRAENAGGAIASDGYNITITSTSFLSNEAEHMGGAIRMKLSKEDRRLVHPSSNMDIKNSIFENNTALSSGGAVAIDYIIVKLSFNRVSFIGNMATQEGGAAYFNISRAIKQLTITNCDFIRNEVKNEMGRGGAIVTYNEQIQILFSRFYTNSAQHGGSIFSQNTSLLTLHENDFISNMATSGGAIYSNTTSVRVYNSTFLHNKAREYGGGLMLSLSYAYFSGYSKFSGNEVKSTSGKGGGIFVSDRREDCSIDSCLISWANHTRVEFSNNIAKQGQMLYGGMLDRCNFTLNKGLETLPARVLYSDGAPYKLDTYGITSDGVRFCYCNKNKPNCHLRQTTKSMFPGQTLKVNAACVDQMEQTVPCFVRSEYKNTDFQLGQGQSVQYLPQCQPLNFTSYAKTANLSTLAITGEILCDQNQWNMLEINITVIKCPTGFEKIVDKCACDSRIEKVFPNAVCNIDEVHVQINQLGWLGSDGNYLKILNICPLNYCSVKKNGINPSDPDAQCSNNRGGILCGECLSNHSVVLGSWKCMDCSQLARYNFIWLTALLALAGVVLVAFLLLVKMTVSSGTINGLIFYANVLSLSGLLDYSTCPVHPVLRVFISWLNLDIGIEVCYYSGMDVYQKTWFQFVFPFYVWGLVGVILVLCRYFPTIMRAMGRRNIEVLATLFLLSYTKILKAIITAFSFTDLKVANATDTSAPLVTERVWVYDGKIPFLNKQHLSLFIIAFLILVLLFLPYTFFLTCGQCIRSIQRRRILKMTRSTYFVTIIDSYHAPYKNRHRNWTGLCLLVRCILFTIFGTSYSIESNLLWIILAVALLLVMRVCIGTSIYKSKMLDLLEFFFLVNLGVLAILLQHDSELCLAITISISLSLVTFVGILIVHCHLEMRKNISCYEQCSQKVQEILLHRKPPEDQQDENDIPILPPESHSTAYINYRESLLSI